MSRFTKVKANRIYQRKAAGRMHDLAKADILLVTDATTLVDSDSGATVVFNDADGATVTLPAATGSGNVFKFIVGVTVTSVADVIQVANSSDVMYGYITAVDSDADTFLGYPALTGDGFDTITFDGSAQGGIIGDTVELIDVLANVWTVTGLIVQSGGSEATPFSAAV